MEGTTTAAESTSLMRGGKNRTYCVILFIRIKLYVNMYIRYNNYMYVLIIMYVLNLVHMSIIPPLFACDL